LWSDHKPLSFALHRVSEPWSARQQRQLSYLAEFAVDIRHIPGQDNVVADTLSRPPGGCEAGPQGRGASGGLSPGFVVGGVGAPQGREADDGHSPGPYVVAVSAVAGGALAPLDYHRLAVSQQTCAETQALLQLSSLTVAKFSVQGEDLWCDVSTGVVRPLVPRDCRHSFFLAFHSIAHPGVRATRRLVSARFVWPWLSADIARWCKDCQECARGKVHKHVHAPLQPFPAPSRKFGHLHLDLVGPLPASKEGHTHLLTVMDRATRWLEVFPLKATTVSACVTALVDGWISRYGVPEDITADRGPQFTSEVWRCLCSRLGIRHRPTTAYHPQANGLVEQFHRQLKEALHSRAAGVDWLEHLPWVMLGLQAAPKEDTNVLTAKLVFGAPLTLPGEFLATPEASMEALVEQIRSGATLYRPLPSRQQPEAIVTPGVPALLREASHVYILRGTVALTLELKYQGPYLVLESTQSTSRWLWGHQWRPCLWTGLRAIEVVVRCSRPSRPGEGAPRGCPVEVMEDLGSHQPLLLQLQRLGGSSVEAATSWNPPVIRQPEYCKKARNIFSSPLAVVAFRSFSWS
jgi:transposase InsO family protein